MGRILVLICVVLFCSCKEHIVHDLSETEVNRLITKLSVASLHPEKLKQSDGRWTLIVREEESIAALTFLSDNRILREERALPPQQSSFISSRDDQRFSLERKLSAELEATLGAVAGILESRVHLNLPPADPLFGQSLDEQKGTASVLIVVEEDAKVERDAIASLVAGASGISKEKVSVLVSRAWQQKETVVTQDAVQITKDKFELISLHGKEIGGAVLGLLLTVGACFFLVKREQHKRLKNMIAYHEA